MFKFLLGISMEISLLSVLAYLLGANRLFEFAIFTMLAYLAIHSSILIYILNLTKSEEGGNKE
jgi:hypothetical protein